MYVDGVPGQLLAEGLTVIVAVAGLVLVLVATNDGVLPSPLAAKPMDVLELAH